MIRVDDLEKFVGGPTPAAQTEVRVSINHQNVIILNKLAYRKLGNPEAVYLHFSRSKNMIVVEPANSVRMPGAFPVKQQTPVNWRINASPFCRHFGIRIDGTERFTNADLNHDGNSLVLRLSETVSVKFFRRTKKTSQ